MVGVEPSKFERRVEEVDADQGEDGAGAAHHQIADRHGAGFRRRGARQHEGDQAAADVGAEDQHDAELDRHDVAGGERDEEQDRGDGGVEQPGHHRRDDEGGDRIAGEVADDDGQELAVAQRVRGFADQAQRQDQQADADEDAAKLQPFAVAGGHEQHRAGDQADGDKQAQIEAQQLDDDRGAEIRAECRQQAGRAADDARANEGPNQQGDRRGALQGNGKRRARADGHHRVAQDAAQFLAQEIAIGALDASAHHARGEQKQRHRARQIEQDDRTAHCAVYL